VSVAATDLRATTDVFGPLSTLNVLSRDHSMELAVIAESLTPISTTPEPNTFMSSSFGQEIVPTHTFTDPPEVEVLIIPGGQQARMVSISASMNIELTKTRRFWDSHQRENGPSRIIHSIRILPFEVRDNYLHRISYSRRHGLLGQSARAT